MFVICCVMGKEGRTHYPVSFLQHGGIFPDVVSSTKVIILLSAGLMPTEARGNYFVPLSIRPIFYFLLQKLICQITWLLTVWKNFRYFRRPPWGLRPVAFATSATWLIRHWFFYYVNTRDSSSSSVSRSRRGPSRRCTTMSAVDSTSPEISNWTCGIVS